MIFQALIGKLKEHQFRGMRRQTEQLDPQTRDNLREFLEDVPAEIEDLEHIQAALDTAHAKLAQLYEKEAFVGKRLTSYRDKLQQYHKQQEEKKNSHKKTTETSEPPPEQAKEVTEEEKETGSKGDSKETNPSVESEDAPPTDGQTEAGPETQKQNDEDANYEKHLQTLQQIELSHKAMKRSIEVLQERIEILENRQHELQHMMDECAVVYQTAESLKNMEVMPGVNETSELFESVHLPPSTAGLEEQPSEGSAAASPSNDGDHAAEDISKNDDDHDEELGDLQLAKKEVASKEPSIAGAPVKKN